jgi:hypothetical protein
MIQLSRVVFSHAGTESIPVHAVKQNIELLMNGLIVRWIQVQFLPYHLEWVTWVQRFAVLIDVILLWTLWPAILNGRSDIKWPPLWITWS